MAGEQPTPLKFAVQAFCAKLRELRRQAGGPPVAVLLRQPGVKLKRAALYDILGGKISRPPNPAVIKAIVKACEAYAKAERRNLTIRADEAFWDDELRYLDVVKEGAEGNANHRLRADYGTRTSSPGDIPVLEISEEHVTFTGTLDAKPIRRRHHGVTPELLRLVRQAEDPAGLAADSQPAAKDAAASWLDAMGDVLWASFLEGNTGAALSRAAEAAAQSGSSMKLAMQVNSDKLRDLPWEALRLPETGESLASHPNIHPFRRVQEFAPAKVRALPGPLQILAAISAPASDGGLTVDYDAEAQRLDALGASSGDLNPRVLILPWATSSAIHKELALHDYHILHLTCQVGASGIILENTDSSPESVSASKVMSSVIGADKHVPIIVLSAAVQRGTGYAAASRAQQHLSAFAATLLRHGAPAVVTALRPADYETRRDPLFKMYAELMESAEPNVAAAVAAASQHHDHEPADSTCFDTVATRQLSMLTLYIRDTPRKLYASGDHAQYARRPSDLSFAEGMTVRKYGDFVGRRPQLRSLVGMLNSSRPGVLLRGIGGVGKSALAIQTIRVTHDELGLVVGLSGQITPDLVLDKIAGRLRSWNLIVRGAPPRHAGPDMPRLTALIADAHLSWRERLELISDHVLSVTPVMLFLDNFEDNQSQEKDLPNIKDSGVASFLTAWLRLPRARLMVTSRHALHLPDGGNFWLTDYHLGPLTLSEARRLIERLPGLSSLSHRELNDAVADVGGHPRALEYLDALLRGGDTQFPDVDARLRSALMGREEIPDPNEWLSERAGDIDRALAETIALIADDVLLNDLLSQLDGFPLARELLIGASVYRLPVDDIGLIWQLPGTQAAPADSLSSALRQLRTARLQHPDATFDELLETASRPETLKAAFRAVRHPAGPASAEFRKAREMLIDLELIAPTHHEDSVSSEVTVHRLTAAAIQRRVSPERIGEAHRRAAAYWQWRVGFGEESHRLDRYVDTQNILGRLENAYHLIEAGEIERAAWAIDVACGQLDARGAFAWAEQVCVDTLSTTGAMTQARATLLTRWGHLAARHASYKDAWERLTEALKIRSEICTSEGAFSDTTGLATLMQLYGNYGEAEVMYRKALSGAAASDDPTAVSAALNNCGNLARRCGDYEAAATFYNRAVDCLEGRFDDKMKIIEVASSERYFSQLRRLRSGKPIDAPITDLPLGEIPLNRRHTTLARADLGLIIRLRGEYPAAEQRYLELLTTHAELVDRMSLASAFNNLALVEQLRASFSDARQHFDRALSIYEAVKDRGRTPIVLHNLGLLALLRGNFDRARSRFDDAFTMFRETNDMAGFSVGYHNAGVLSCLERDYEQASELYMKSAGVYEKLSDPVGIAMIYNNLGVVAQRRQSFEEAENLYNQALDILTQSGDSMSCATAASNIGAARTESGYPVEAIHWNLLSFMTRARARIPEAMIDVRWLKRQHRTTGEKLFRSALSSTLKRRDADILIQYINEVPEPG